MGVFLGRIRLNILYSHETWAKFNLEYSSVISALYKSMAATDESPKTPASHKGTRLNAYSTYNNVFHYVRSTIFSLRTFLFVYSLFYLI